SIGRLAASNGPCRVRTNGSGEEDERDLSDVNGAAVAGAVFVDPKADRRLFCDRERNVFLKRRQSLPFRGHRRFVDDRISGGVEDGDAESGLKGGHASLDGYRAGYNVAGVGDIDLVDVVGGRVRVVSTDAVQRIWRFRGLSACSRRARCEDSPSRAGCRRRFVAVAASGEDSERGDCEEQKNLHSKDAWLPRWRLSRRRARGACPRAKPRPAMTLDRARAIRRFEADRLLSLAMSEESGRRQRCLRAR